MEELEKGGIVGGGEGSKGGEVLWVDIRELERGLKNL